MRPSQALFRTSTPWKKSKIQQVLVETEGLELLIANADEVVLDSDPESDQKDVNVEI